MSRAFYNLPEPTELGLRWKAFEKAREKITRVEGRRRAASQAASDLEKKIREEKSDDVRRLAQSILAGEAEDDLSTAEDLDDLLGELREQRRLEEALEQALPQAEEGLRQTIFENQVVWKSRADKVLEKAIESEREAYEQARQLAETARKRRQYAEALALWLRNPSPSFGVPSDVTIATTVQQTWGDDLGRCERQLHERQLNEEGVA